MLLNIKYKLRVLNSYYFTIYFSYFFLNYIYKKKYFFLNYKFIYLFFYFFIHYYYFTKWVI